MIVRASTDRPADRDGDDPATVTVTSRIVTADRSNPLFSTVMPTVRPIIMSTIQPPSLVPLPQTVRPPPLIFNLQVGYDDVGERPPPSPERPADRHANDLTTVGSPLMYSLVPSEHGRVPRHPAASSQTSRDGCVARFLSSKAVFPYRKAY